MRALTGRRAAAVLTSDIEAFERLGYRPLERRRPLEATLRSPDGGLDIFLRLRREGRIFGGNWALEVATANPVLPASSGLSARARGIVRTRGIRFRGDRDLAARLSADSRLAEALARVHFERLSVDSTGRPVIRHMGGSVVWMIFPPIVRATPFPPEQARETVRALTEFARVGEDLL